MRYFITIILLLFSFHRVSAQTWSTTVSGNINVSTVMVVTLSAQAATPTFTTTSDYLNGKITTNYCTYAIKSNVNWLINFKAQSTYFTPQTTGAATDMPATVLGLKLTTNATYSTVTTTAQTLKTGNRGDAAVSGNTFKTDMKYNPGFTYPGGLYSISLLYTVSQQ